MLIFYIALFILVVHSLKPCKANGNYLSFETTNAIKGIFILLVFIKHATPYISNAGYSYSNFGDNIFRLIDANVGQWIVAMFLFYSGYGVMESIKKKGSAYVASIPQNRVLNVLVNFDVAVLVFICVALVLGREITIGQCALSIIAWDSVGNSNWYIFCILICYLAVYFSFRLNGNNFRTDKLKAGGVIAVILLAVSMLLLSCVKAPWWYDTMLCFAAGLLFSIHKPAIEEFMAKKYWLALFALFVLLVMAQVLPFHLRGLRYNIFSIVFCFIIVALTMRIEVKSKTLTWFGKNLFPLYIYQRIPMIILAAVANGVIPKEYPVFYTLACFICTLLIAYYYKFWNIKKLFNF